METYIKIIQTIQSHSMCLAPPPQLTDVVFRFFGFFQVPWFLKTLKPWKPKTGLIIEFRLSLGINCIRHLLEMNFSHNQIT
jgi:hypothetical protein